MHITREIGNTPQNYDQGSDIEKFIRPLPWGQIAETQIAYEGGGPVDVLLATLTVDGSIEDLKPVLQSYGESLAAFPGYVDHFWLASREELAILHIFKDQASLQEYEDSIMLATLAAHPNFDGRVYEEQFQFLSDVKQYSLGAVLAGEMIPSMAIESSPFLGIDATGA